MEELETGPPHEVALENAYRKAAAAATEDAEQPVLGVDTIVSIGSRIWGKPADDGAGDRDAACAAGTPARGDQRRVRDRRRKHPDRGGHAPRSQFRSLDDALIDWYLSSGEWRERAGGYAIQGRGAALVASIEGDYTNVVGLPVPTLLELAPWLLPLGRPT